MARSGNYQITGYELQAMVNENLIGQKGSIPQTNRCLTRAEVLSGVHCYAGPQDPYVPSIPYTSWDIGGGVSQFGASPYLTCNYNYITALPSNASLLFEMSQEGNPYLNVDLFATANGVPLRLDPNNDPPLDGMFFGSPQYSPQMGSAVKLGTSVVVSANFGLDYAESPGNFGWNAPGYGFLEVYANNSLISDQNLYKYTASGPNAQQLTYTFTVQSGVNYYVKAWSLVTYMYEGCYSVNNPYHACGGDGNCGCIQC
jgi:hypothetical protein